LWLVGLLQILAAPLILSPLLSTLLLQNKPFALEDSRHNSVSSSWRS